MIQTIHIFLTDGPGMSGAPSFFCSEHVLDKNPRTADEQRVQENEKRPRWVAWPATKYLFFFSNLPGLELLHEVPVAWPAVLVGG